MTDRRPAATAGLAGMYLLAALILSGPHEVPHGVSEEQPLPKIAPAPAFALTSHDGQRIALADLRGLGAGWLFGSLAAGAIVGVVIGVPVSFYLVYRKYRNL